MSKNIKKIGVLTSGGDSPGMNACIRAVVRTAIYHDLIVVGVMRGYEGLIDGDFEKLESHSVSNIIQKGGTILKSARSERFRTKDGRRTAYDKIKRSGMDALITIGGDGTFKGANIFGKEFDFPIIGIPGTIDNDLFGTDYTLGYDTATNTALEAIDRIRDTADAHDRLFFIEVMGRDAGFIALRTGIAGGAEAILVPETKTNIENLIDQLKDNWRMDKTSSIVVVAEGDEAGGAFEIARIVKQEFDQFDMRVTILGHVQRGGNPSCRDRVLGSILGVASVEALLEGKRDVMVGEVNNKVCYTPLENATKHHNNISPELFKIAKILST